MRLYTFINFYLSSIQQGIQTAHIMGELVNLSQSPKYDPSKKEQILNWCKNHKTIVVCNGGNGEGIRNIIDLFENPINPYPFAYFYEDCSVDGLLTGVGIIVPEEIYEMKSSFEVINGQRTKIYTYDQPGKVKVILDEYLYQLIDTIKSAPLAR